MRKRGSTRWRPTGIEIACFATSLGRTVCALVKMRFVKVDPAWRPVPRADYNTAGIPGVCDPDESLDEIETGKELRRSAGPPPGRGATARQD